MSNKSGNSVQRISIIMIRGLTRYAEYERRLKGNRIFDSRIFFEIPFGSVAQLRMIQQMEAAQIILLNPAYIIEASKGIWSWDRINTRKNSEKRLINQKVLRVN